MSNEFKSWEEMTDLEQAQCLYWDMYKDAHGVRPRGIDTSSWTLADFNKEFEYLGKVIDREEAARREAEAQAIAAFNELVKSYGFDNAKRYQHDAYGTQGDDEYLCYHLGLPYGYFKQAA